MSGKARPKKSKLSKRRDPPLGGLDAYGAAAANMLYDPCGAELVPTVYSGDRGYINRFIANSSVSIVALDTVSILVVKPGNQTCFFAGGATSTTNTAVTWNNTLYPGKPFYNTNASKARSAGYCMAVRPNSAPNTATGTIYFGNVSASAFPNGINVNADALIPLLSESVSCSQALMNPLEVKWCPGGFDDRYNTVGVNIDDDSDRNVLVVVTIGLPAASGLNVRQTALTEWTPNNALSITNDATAIKPSVCDKDCILQHLKRKNPNWWWNLGRKAVDVTTSIATGYYTGGIVGAMGGAVKFM